MKKFLGFSFAIIVASFIGLQGGASALTANYNDVIDDTVFDNANSMDAAQIDAFLNSFSGSCISTNKGFTAPDPIGYNPSQGFLFGGNVSAGTVIYHAAQAYGINPQVILATLQKEQSLVNGSAGCHPNNPDPNWPFSSSPAPNTTFTCSVGGRSTTCTYACPNAYGGGCMNVALGYNCPGYCKTADENFSKQIISASWSLTFYRHRSEGQNNWYASKPNWDNSNDLGFCYSGYDVAGGPYYLCPDQASHANDPFVSHSGQYVIDGQVVTMTNGATAALFDYTPHLHGQDTFVTNFTNWFGPTTSLMNGITMTNITQPDPNPARGETVQYVFSLTNTFSFPVTLDAVGVVGRPGSVTGSTNRDFGWQGPVTLQPSATQQFTFSALVQDTGVVYAWPAIVRSGIYTHYNNWGAAMNAHNPNISLTSPLTASITSPVAGQTVSFSATVKNNEPYAIDASAVGIPIRYYGRYNYDTAWTVPSGSSIPAGATYPLSGNVLLDKAGPYTAWVSGLIANQFTTLSSNLNVSAAVPTPKFSLTFLETPNATPALGEDVTVKFSLKNNSGIPMTLDAVGVVGRYGSPSSSQNNDFGWAGPVTFADGEEKSFTSFVSNVSALSNYYAWVAIEYKGGFVQYTPWTFMMIPHSPNLTISAPLTINSGTKPNLGQNVPVTVTIKNNEPHPINFSALGIPVRYYGRYNYDAIWQGPGTLAASGQSGDTITLNGSDTFDKSGPYTFWASIFIQGRYITIGSMQTLNM